MYLPTERKTNYRDVLGAIVGALNADDWLDANGVTGTDATPPSSYRVKF